MGLAMIISLKKIALLLLTRACKLIVSELCNALAVAALTEAFRLPLGKDAGKLAEGGEGAGVG